MKYGLLKSSMTKIAFGLSAVAGLSFMTNSAEAEVKVGVAMAVTGPIPSLVAPMVEAAQIAINDINSKGGVLGQDLVAPLVDSQCSPQPAVDAVEKLISLELVSMIVGPVCSGATIAAAENASITSGTVMVSPSASSPAITSMDDNDLLYRTAPSDAFQGAAIASYILGMGMDNVALTFANDDYNVGIANVFRTEFTKGGGTISGDQVHEPEKNSYRSELATLARSGADTLVIFSYYNAGGNVLLRQSLENGLFVRYVGADGMAAQAMVDEIGAANLTGNSWWTTNTVETDNDSYRNFAQMIEAADKEVTPDGPYVASSFDAMYLAALAIEANGSDSRQGLSEALRKVASAPGEVVRPGEWDKAVALLKAGKDINYEGASGSLDFDSVGDVSGVYSVNLVKDGTLTKVETLR